MIDTQYIKWMISWIEHNLAGDLNAVTFADSVYRSRMQLHRDFYSIVGHTVKSYIAKRRLSIALAHIKASVLPLADIAYLSGYSSQQSLCRAVKQELGMTPLEYRNSNTYFDFPPYEGLPLYSVIVSEENIPETLCLRFYHPCLRGIEDRATDRLFRTIPQYKGRLFGRNGEQRGHHFCYELYITDQDVDREILEKFGFEIADVQSPSKCLYAFLTVPNEEEKIGDAWDYLYKTWLGNSMFEYTEAPYFEEYIQGNSNIACRPARLRLYLPIRKRGENMRITLLEQPELHFLTAHAKGINAERDASRRVINYVSTHHPYSAHTMREFLVKKQSDTDYICGVRIGAPLAKKGITDEQIEEYATGCANYLMLESSVMGDYDRMAALLLHFAKDNHFEPDADDLFAVYDAAQSYDNPKIRMYCGVKMLQNGNTPAREHGIISLP